MPASSIAVRLLTLLFLLAGILLLQKPVFGETITAATNSFAVIRQEPACAATTAASPWTTSPSPSTTPRK